MSQLLTFPSPSNTGTNTSVGKRRSFSPHPPWIVHLINEIDPYQQRIFNCPLVKDTSRGTLSLEQMRGWLMQLYPFIETFPQWIALNITKAPQAFAREILYRQRTSRKMACQTVDGYDGRIWNYS